MYGAMWLVSLPGEPVPLLAGVALLVCWGLYKKRYKLTSWFAGINLIAIALVQVIKRIMAIPRPVGSTEMGFAFPSQHTAVYVVFWGLLIYWIRRSDKPKWMKTLVWIMGLVMIVSVGVSRIYLGDHWVTDVVGGYIVGILILGCAILVYPSDLGQINYRTGRASRPTHKSRF